MTTATETDILEALDFEHGLGCEIDAGGAFCGAAARWIARLRCAQCGCRDALPLCRSHRDQMLDDEAFLIVGICETCGFNGAPLLDSLEPLR